MTSPPLWSFYIWLVNTIAHAFLIHFGIELGKIAWRRRQYNRYSEARRRMADRRGVL